MASLSAAYRAKCADQIGISVRRFLPGKAVKKGNVKEEEWLLLLSGAELREGREKWAEETFARQRPDKKARLTIKKKWFQEETTQEVFVAPPPVFDFWKVGVRCPDERHVQILLGREDCFEASEVLPVFGGDKDKKKSFIPQEHGLDEREEIIEIPDGYEAVCAGAFCGWSRLREIRFSDAVVEIGDRAFAGCTQLSKIGWSENVRRSEMRRFADAISCAARRCRTGWRLSGEALLGTAPVCAASFCPVRSRRSGRMRSLDARLKRSRRERVWTRRSLTR